MVKVIMKIPAILAAFLFSTSVVQVASMASVPKRMLLSSIMKATEVGKASLTNIILDTDAKTVTTGATQTGSDILHQHGGKHGSVCFVVRRPGWVLCREQGKQLMDLAAQEDKPLDGFGIFGTIKETAVDDEGLVEFYEKSFTFPIYKDENLTFYEFFGKKKLGLNSYNPLRLYRGYKKMMKRINAKGLSGNLVGEGMVQGGIIVFDKNGQPKFAYEEDTGKEVPVEDLLLAVKAVKEGRDEL